MNQEHLKIRFTAESGIEQWEPEFQTQFELWKLTNPAWYSRDDYNDYGDPLNSFRNE